MGTFTEDGQNIDASKGVVGSPRIRELGWPTVMFTSQVLLPQALEAVTV